MNNSSNNQGVQTNLQCVCNTVVTVTPWICATYLIHNHSYEIKDTIIDLVGSVKKLVIEWKDGKLDIETHGEQAKALPEPEK